MKVHIHPGRGELTTKLRHEVPNVVVVDENNEVVEHCRKVLLTGNWILRQYRNPVPCGATHVLLPTANSQYEVLKYD